LIDQNVNYKYSVFQEALNRDRYDLTDKLLQQGYNINEKVAQSSFFYETIGYLTNAINKNDAIEVFTNRLKYLLDNDLDPYLEDNFKRNSFFRIKRIDDEAQREKVEQEVMRIVKSNYKRKL
jgi:hypothetical protein